MSWLVESFPHFAMCFWQAEHCFGFLFTRHSPFLPKTSSCLQSTDSVSSGSRLVDLIAIEIACCISIQCSTCLKVSRIDTNNRIKGKVRLHWNLAIEKCSNGKLVINCIRVWLHFKSTVLYQQQCTSLKNAWLAVALLSICSNNELITKLVKCISPRHFQLNPFLMTQFRQLHIELHEHECTEATPTSMRPGRGHSIFDWMCNVMFINWWGHV